MHPEKPNCPRVYRRRPPQNGGFPMIFEGFVYNVSPAPFVQEKTYTAIRAQVKNLICFSNLCQIAYRYGRASNLNAFFFRAENGASACGLGFTRAEGVFFRLDKLPCRGRAVKDEFHKGQYFTKKPQRMPVHTTSSQPSNFNRFENRADCPEDPGSCVGHLIDRRTPGFCFSKTSGPR